MKVHLDHPWSDCVRNEGAPVRLYITTGSWWIVMGQAMQVWDTKKGSWTWKRISRQRV
jgi:hypothetical protein